MNAPRNKAMRQALKSVTLDDKQRRSLQHIDTAGCAAGRGGFGVHSEQGDTP